MVLTNVYYLAKNLEPLTDVLYSVGLDLDSYPESRRVKGYHEVRCYSSFIVQGIRTLLGAIYRLQNGDQLAWRTLALAGNLISQSVERIVPFVDPILSNAPRQYQQQFNYVFQGYTEQLVPQLNRVVTEIKNLVGIPMWESVREAATIMINESCLKQ